jgi:phosphodiesterase/alkaline phosphatase D-like protein
MGGKPVPVAYEIAHNPQMKASVRRGTAMAAPGSTYSVHAEITGLAPGRHYWYCFMSGAAKSAIGRAMPSPAAQTAPTGLKFGFVSCANYEHGFFSAYRHLVEEDPDLLLFLGDYIYEYVDMRSPDAPQQRRRSSRKQCVLSRTPGSGALHDRSSAGSLVVRWVVEIARPLERDRAERAHGRTPPEGQGRRGCVLDR